MKNFKFGDIVLTQFPYASGEHGKQRPALVLIDTEDKDVIIAVITSKTPKTAYDVAIKEWERANLLFPSMVRTPKILTKEKSTIIGQLGQLTENDLKEINKIVKKLWSNF